jgi:nucleoside-diphosphate-sugar epimerase
MSRVLVTGGVSAIGSSIVRRLLADPVYDVRVADRKDAPQWMREGCEIRRGDLRDVHEATSAISGCPYVIHLASPAEPQQSADFSLIAASAALDSALLCAAIDRQVQRFVYVSCAAASTHAGEPSTGKPHLSDCPPLSARGFAKLVGERLCHAAHAEHGLPFTICRPAACPPAHVDDIAAEILAAMSSPD